MIGYFMRPKSSTRDDARGMKHVEPIGVVAEYDNEYIGTSGFTPSVSGISGGVHRRDPIRREAPSGYPLPAGNWRG